jgi:hypothetical protein
MKTIFFKASGPMGIFGTSFFAFALRCQGEGRYITPLPEDRFRRLSCRSS